MQWEPWFQIVRLRLRSLLRRGVLEQELDRELQFHLEQETEKNLDLGLTPSEARSAALRRLGGVAQIQEECRDMRRTSYIENFVSDLRYAVRTLVKAPVFTLAAIATLTLGIGANTAIFQLLDAVRLRSLPVLEPHRLAQIKIRNMNFGISQYPDNLSYPLFQQIREHQRAFSSIFAWAYTTLRIGQGAETRRVSVLGVSGELFPTLGVLPAGGRLFRPEDDLRGCAAPTVVLSSSFWQREFGGSLSAIGSRLIVQDHPLEVIGVAPAGFSGPEVGTHFDLALPLCSVSVLNDGDTTPFDRSDYSWLNVMGRLRPGWTRAQASEHLRAISPGLMQATAPSGYSRNYVENYYLQSRLESISGATGVSRLREAYDRSLWLLLGLTGLVLLIACANLSSLMLARARAREREFAVRLALGAGRGRLIRQTLTEGLLLAAVGAVFGLALASLFSRAILRFLEVGDTRLSLDLTPDWRMLAFTAAVTCLTCVLLSLAPALRAARGQAAEAMKAGARGLVSGRSRLGFQRLLVVVQVSISLMLVAGAFLFVSSFRRLIALDLGFRAQGILQASFELGKQDRDESVLRRLLEEVRAVPQVESAAATTNFLIGSGMWSLVVRTDGATRDSRFTWVSPGFFATLGTPVLAGRDFSSNDRGTSPKVAVVNEIFAQTFFPGSDPIGKTFRTVTEPDYPEAEYEIVGLVKNTRYFALRAAEPPMVYAPVNQYPPGVTGTMIFIRSSAALPAVETAVRRRIAVWRPGTGMQFQVFQQTISDTLVRERLLAALSGFFGVLAALLASIGLYGVLAYQAVRRRGEIGIRLAVGATRGQIMQLVLREAAILVFLGLVIGVCGFLAVARAAASLLFGISARDPYHIGAAVIVLAVAGAIGSMLPARHASRLDPMNALRDE
ncbi:MAG: ABC transporter permease [Bryobacteraceae bacterium]